MSKEEILAMDPGISLDTLVNKRVMNYPMPDFIPECALELQLTGNPVHLDGWTCICIYSEGDIPRWIPDHYSTDISAAWKIVEKLDGAWDIKKRYKPHPNDPIGSEGRSTYRAVLTLSEYNPYDVILINERCGVSPWCWHVAETICKAALLAITKEVSC